jgi:hypothetical protein
MGSMDVYVADFEAALLDSSRAYYARKVKIALDDFIYSLMVMIRRHRHGYRKTPLQFT